MIRLSKLSDYAIVVLTTMAAEPGERYSVSTLADKTGVPTPTVAKLLKSLTQSGLLDSRRGASGGYALTRAAEEITIADIIRALDGPIALTACVEGAENTCTVEGLCPMRGGWEKLNRALSAALDSVSLSDMMAPGWVPTLITKRPDGALSIR